MPTPSSDEKKRFFEFQANLGQVQVRMRTSQDNAAMDLPNELLKSTTVAINFSHKFGSPLQLSGLGVSQLLSFPGIGHYMVHVPWDCVFYIQGPEFRGVAPYRHWPTDDPTFQGFEGAIEELLELTGPSDQQYGAVQKPSTSVESKESKRRTKNRKAWLELTRGGVGPEQDLPTPPVRDHLRLITKG